VIAGLLCATVAGLLIHLFDAADNWVAFLICLLGLWCVFRGQQWLERHTRTQPNGEAGR